MNRFGIRKNVVFGRGGFCSQGFTLIETLVAMAMISGLLLVISKSVEIGNSSNKNALQYGEWTTLLADIQGVLNNSSHCKFMFTQPANALTMNPGSNPPIATKTGIVVMRNNNGVPIIVAQASPAALNDLVITNVQVTGVAKITPINGGATLYNATLQIDGKKASMANERTLGSQNLTQKFPFIIAADAAGTTFVSCFTQNNDQSVCNSIGGYYLYGQNPPCSVGWTEVSGGGVSKVTLQPSVTNVVVGGTIPRAGSNLDVQGTAQANNLIMGSYAATPVGTVSGQIWTVW